jgi:D-serine deaminase-like pyridoxal phosphate-dependent protein
VWFLSDEHTTFAPPLPVGAKVAVIPAHVDPTLACHERLFLYEGNDEVVDEWPVDLRGW